MASLTRLRFARDDRGISDVLAMTFMFLIMIVAGVLLHAYRSDAISSATKRQLWLKTEYLYKTLELAWVENYSISFFEAVTENLIGVTRTDMPGDYLRERIDNLLSYLRPPNWAVLIELTCENSSWVQLCPSDASMPSPAATQYTFSGKWTKLIAEAGENRIVSENIVLTVFKPGV